MLRVPRSSWKGCRACWRQGLIHNGAQAVLGGPCYIRFGYCEHYRIDGLLVGVGGFRLRPSKKLQAQGYTRAAHDRAGRFVWLRVF
jgi:hypothetical protein